MTSAITATVISAASEQSPSRMPSPRLGAPPRDEEKRGQTEGG